MRHLILVLDNDFETPELLRETLTPVGFEVVWVNAAAILDNEWLKRSKFEGIILNFDMRHHPGVTVLERLYKQGINIPVIVMSSTADREQLEAAVRHGAHDYLLKPLDTAKLQTICLRHFTLGHYNIR
jgi:DNA-binding NtrC family response regulator